MIYYNPDDKDVSIPRTGFINWKAKHKWLDYRVVDVFQSRERVSLIGK